MNPCMQGFNGLRPDPLSGAYHPGNGYRTFSPPLKRFTAPDGWSPFGAGGINPYAYCAGDPVNHTDPSGHLSWQAGAGIALGVLGIAGTVLTAGASLVAAGSLSAALATSSAVALTSGTSAFVADATGLASLATATRSPQAAAILGWASLAAGLLSLGLGLAVGGYRVLGKATAPLQARMVRVNGRPGLMMSGEFRNARFLGASHTAGGLSWNLRFEDRVPLGRRLTVIMGSVSEEGLIRPLNEVRMGDAWVPNIYRPSQFRELVVARHEDFAVYRLVIPNSAQIYCSASRTLARDFLSILHDHKPGVIIGFRGTTSARGPLADALKEVFGLFSDMEAMGIAWNAGAAQTVLDAASARFGAVAGAITFEGERVVYPRDYRAEAYEPNWQ